MDTHTSPCPSWVDRARVGRGLRETVCSPFNRPKTTTKISLFLMRGITSARRKKHLCCLCFVGKMKDVFVRSFSARYMFFFFCLNFFFSLCLFLFFFPVCKLTETPICVGDVRVCYLSIFDLNLDFFSLIFLLEIFSLVSFICYTRLYSYLYLCPCICQCNHLSLSIDRLIE